MLVICIGAVSRLLRKPVRPRERLVSRGGFRYKP